MLVLSLQQAINNKMPTDKKVMKEVEGYLQDMGLMLLTYEGIKLALRNRACVGPLVCLVAKHRLRNVVWFIVCRVPSLFG